MEKWWETRMLTLEMLEIDKRYQRSLDLAWVKDIAKNFDPSMVGILHVSARKGHYYVFDGQHTLKALEIVYHDKKYPVACKVYHGLTEQDEAKLFCDLNQRKKKISPVEIMKAQTISGDELTANFLACTRAAGFIIDPTKQFKCRYGLNAVRKAQTCYMTLGEEKYTKMLTFIRETWNGEPWSVSQKMLAGMTTLISAFSIEQKQFVQRMHDVTETDIERMSHNYYSLSMSYRYAWAIGRMYNRGGGRKCLKLTKLNFLDEE